MEHQKGKRRPDLCRFRQPSALIQLPLKLVILKSPLNRQVIRLMIREASAFDK